MNSHHVEKPEIRGPLRKYLGKEYFILKRSLKWLFNSNSYAKKCSESEVNKSIIKHKSFLLRPLKDVDMILQHNKVTI